MNNKKWIIAATKAENGGYEVSIEGLGADILTTFAALSAGIVKILIEGGSSVKDAQHIVLESAKTGIDTQSAHEATITEKGRAIQ